jgi:hypothetical protein
MRDLGKFEMSLVKINVGLQGMSVVDQGEVPTGL